MLSFLLLFAANLSAQTTLVNPAAEGGFENGATFATNGWTVTNDFLINGLLEQQQLLTQEPEVPSYQMMAG